MQRLTYVNARGVSVTFDSGAPYVFWKISGLELPPVEPVTTQGAGQHGYTVIPKAQIIATTHSPSIIQCAKPNEIISLVHGKDNNIKINSFAANEYGFQGWTIEEILTDVMGMETTYSELYEKTVEKFDNAMDDEDYFTAREQYNILKKMLHPSNPMNKVLEIQIAGLGE